MSDKTLIFWTFDNSLFGDDDKLVDLYFLGKKEDQFNDLVFASKEAADKAMLAFLQSRDWKREHTYYTTQCRYAELFAIIGYKHTVSSHATRSCPQWFRSSARCRQDDFERLIQSCLHHS